MQGQLGTQGAFAHAQVLAFARLSHTHTHTHSKQDTKKKSQKTGLEHIF